MKVVIMTDIKWSAAFTFNAAFKNIVDTGIVFYAIIVGIQASWALYTYTKKRYSHAVFALNGG